MKILRVATFFISMFLQVYAFAQLAPVGTDTYLTNYVCRMTFSGECKVALTPDFPGDEIGSKQYYVSSVDSSFLNMYGSARANARFVEGSLLPILGAYASGGRLGPELPNPNPQIYTGSTATMMDANVWAVGHYRYTGRTPTQLSITAKLDTSFSNLDLQGHSHMQIGVFSSEDYRFDVDGICPIGGFIGCNSNSTNLATLGAYGDPRVSFTLMTIYFNVKYGDEFYTGAMLDANVCCGATVDSAHTMTMQFNDDSMIEMLPVLRAPIASIPEPNFYILLIIGLFLFVAKENKFKSLANSLLTSIRSTP